MNWLFTQVFAETPGVALLEPTLVGERDGTRVSGLTNYMGELVGVFFTLIIVGAVIMIVIGGLEYTLGKAAGSKEEAKSRIWSAIWGLILALAAVIILKTINPDLITLKLLFP